MLFATVSSEQDLRVDGLHQLEKILLDFFGSISSDLLNRFELHCVHSELLAQLDHLFVKVHAVGHRLREVNADKLSLVQERDRT